MRAISACLILTVLCAVASTRSSAQQCDTSATDTTRADTARVDTTRVQKLAPTVVTGTRLGAVDERTPVQVDEIPMAEAPPGPTGAAEAIARLPGVSVFDDQGTRAQPTLEIRGFRLSPVVGVSQGVSVFLDGVRINEPDAQEINFDLIPMDAVSDAELVRGPGTLFGKNSLAGALVLSTKRGQLTPELDANLQGGRFGYQAAQVSGGGVLGGVDGFLMARGTEEDGFRVQTPARTRQIFLNVGRKGDSTDLAMTVMHAHNRIFQAGSLPESWLRVDPSLNFTGGDFFEPDLWHIAARGELPLAGGTVRGNAFRRTNNYQQFNVNVDAPSTNAHVDNESTGGTLEWTRPALVAGMPLGLTLGAEYSRNNVDYRIFSVPTTDAPEFEDECDQRTGLCENARVNEDDAALYAQGVLSVTPALAVTASMRGDYVRIPFRDLRDSGNDGTNTFRRFSPRLGVNYYLDAANLRGYAAVSTGFRAPAALELACADEASPCALPFSLGDDPPLDPVTVVNYESGIDWEPGEGTFLDILGFREDTRNEIVFVAARTTTGFFQNIARARRQGIEASASLTLPAGFRVFGSYGLIDATYQSAVLLASEIPAPDSALPGDRFPLSPRHRGSVGVELTRPVGKSLIAGQLAVRAVSSQFLRGNDANLDQVNVSEEGAPRFVSGLVSGYAVTNLQLRYERRHVAISADVSNLFDHRYETFGIFGENPAGPIGGPRPAEPMVERFLNPGYPRTLTISLEAKP